MTGARVRRQLAAGRGRRRRWLHLLAIVLIPAAVVMGIDMRLRPVIENMAAYQAKIYAVRVINDAMGGELERMAVDYRDLVTVTQNREGEVSSIQTNMLQVNQLKNQVVDAVIQDLEQEENRTLCIPVGTLLGNQFTSGWGPEVTIRVIPSGYVQSEIYNQFTAAGINQTLHQVMLKINIQMIAVLPGYTVQTDTATNYCIAQTVIVGAVPEGFTDINGDDSSTIAKFNDYNRNDVTG